MTGNRKTISKVGTTGGAGNIGKTLTEGLADEYDLTLFHHRREIQEDYRQKFETVKVESYIDEVITLKE